VIVHKDIGTQFDGIDVDRLLKYLKHPLPVGIVLENVLLFVASAGYMIHCTGILYAEWSGHEIIYHGQPSLSTLKI